MFVGISPLERYSLYRDMSPFPFLLPFFGIPSKKTDCLILFFPKMLLIQDSLLRELYVSYIVFLFSSAVSFFLDTPSLFLLSGTDKSRQELPSSFLSRPLVCKVSSSEYCRPPYEQGDGRSPERRCSSRTFRYGYLVTT